MADEKQLAHLLYEERGIHFKVLAEEFDRLSKDFAAKAERARATYEQYRDGAKVVYGERLGAEFEKIWDDNIETLYKS